MVDHIKEKILAGGEVTDEECQILLSADIGKLCAAADEIRRVFCGDRFEVCSITNGKSGRCSENCKFCAQSAYYDTDIDVYGLRDSVDIEKEALYNKEYGVQHFSIVTSGRKLSKAELDKVCSIYENLGKRDGLKLCASHGLLDYEDFVRLKNAGVTRYHNNLETSREFFPHVCTTHSFDNKVAAIMDAQNAGLDVCSGGIMGIGESMKDRLSMAFELKRLSIMSIPLNILSPVADTPFADYRQLSYAEIKRTVALYRFINPGAYIRLAGGRKSLPDGGRELLHGGVNAMITGDMLTTAGLSIESDMQMIGEMQFQIV